MPHVIASLPNIVEANFSPRGFGRKGRLEPLQAPYPARDTGSERRETVPVPFFLFFPFSGAAVHPHG